MASSTQEVLHDLVHERGLSDWRVVTGDHNAAIFGRARVDCFDETRASRKRKPNGSTLATVTDASDQEAMRAWCCFLVVPTTSGRQLSVGQLAELQRTGVERTPEGVPLCERTFLCLTDAATVSYYRITSGLEGLVPDPPEPTV